MKRITYFIMYLSKEMRPKENKIGVASLDIWISSKDEIFGSFKQ